MIAPLNSDWEELLTTEIEKPYFKDLTSFIEEEYIASPCFPQKNKIFNALNLCPFKDVKVVILGQDPYHKPGLANGLCFSVNSEMPIPASLKNIYREIESDLQVTAPNHGNLTAWAKQGILLLNATLTVKMHKAGSHQNKGWETFTDAIITLISSKKENVVFMLWGGYAKKKGGKINVNKHLILEAGHPSPLSANRGFWYGNKHFSSCNLFLEKHKTPTIQWIPDSYSLF